MCRRHNRVGTLKGSPVSLDESRCCGCLYVRSHSNCFPVCCRGRLELGPNAAAVRVNRLFANGVIRGIGATIDPRAFGFGLQAFVDVKLQHGTSMEAFEKALRRVKRVPVGAGTHSRILFSYLCCLVSFGHYQRDRRRVCHRCAGSHNGQRVRPGHGGDCCCYSHRGATGCGHRSGAEGRRHAGRQSAG